MKPNFVRGMTIISADVFDENNRSNEIDDTIFKEVTPPRIDEKSRKY